MKQYLVLLVVLLGPAFSYAQENGDVFIGAWKNMDNSGSRYRNLRIMRVHEKYFLSFNDYPEFKMGVTTHLDTANVGSLEYKMDHGRLTGDKNYGDVVFLESSGDVKWNGSEWKKKWPK